MPATAAGKIIIGWRGAVSGMADINPCRYGLYELSYPLFIS
jgi:hypothetical protein